MQGFVNGLMAMVRTVPNDFSIPSRTSALAWALGNYNAMDDINSIQVTRGDLSGTTEPRLLNDVLREHNEQGTSLSGIESAISIISGNLSTTRSSRANSTTTASITASLAAMSDNQEDDDVINFSGISVAESFVAALDNFTQNLAAIAFRIGLPINLPQYVQTAPQQAYRLTQDLLGQIYHPSAIEEAGFHFAAQVLDYFPEWDLQLGALPEMWRPMQERVSDFMHEVMAQCPRRVRPPRALTTEPTMVTTLEPITETTGDDGPSGPPPPTEPTDMSIDAEGAGGTSVPTVPLQETQQLQRHDVDLDPDGDDATRTRSSRTTLGDYS